MSAGTPGPTARHCSGCANFAPGTDYTRGVAITSSVHPDADTHLEPVRFGQGHDAMCALVAALTDGGKRIPRFLRWLGNELRHPVRHLRLRKPSDWAKETIILLGMQTVDNYFHLKLGRPWFFPFVKILATSPVPNAGTRPGFRPATTSAAGWRRGPGASPPTSSPK